MADFRTNRLTRARGDDFCDRLLPATNHNLLTLLDLMEKTREVCFGLVDRDSHQEIVGLDFS